jgi:hypothetical protein
MGQIASGLADLEKLNCLTPTCTEFKELLTERAVLSLEKLADVSGQWAPMLNMIAMLPIGQRINGLRPPGVSGGMLDSPRVQAAIERLIQTRAARTGVVPAKNSNPTSAITDAETGMPNDHLVSAGNGAARPPVNPAVPGKNPNNSSAATDAEAGMPYDRPVVPGSTPIVPGGGLAAHEAAGGHLIAKHVGKSEAELLQRLAAEPKITGSSSFFDRASAEKAVSQTLSSRNADIQAWLSGEGKKLQLDHRLLTPVGITVSKGANSAVQTNNLRVVLVRDAKMPTGYKILTGFPRQ